MIQKNLKLCAKSTLILARLGDTEIKMKIEKCNLTKQILFDFSFKKPKFKFFLWI